MEPQQKSSEAKLIEQDEDVLVLTTKPHTVVGDFKMDMEIEASSFAVLVEAERGLSHAWAKMDNCQKELIKLEYESDWENENAWQEWDMKVEDMSKINEKLILSYQKVRRARNFLYLCKMMTRRYKKLRNFAF